MRERQEKRPTLALTLVCGRRPALLQKTLASFSERVFRHFEISDVYANLDPFAGGPDEHAACLRLIRDTFPQARIFEPETPSFGAAVQRLWSHAPDGTVLHLEDDWIANEDIKPDRVLPLLSGRTRAVVPLSVEHKWNGKTPFKTHVIKTRLFGWTVWRRRAGTFGTSPRFIDGAFARTCAGLMNPDLDPEKQMYLPHNRKLHDFMAPYGNRLLPARDGGPLITDIGREWRDSRGMAKVVSGGRSEWVTG
ncbi:hypothetical protein [Roseitranquillus sediminis]|uniref:hypothetical protein n=1 Tax=Roseitranquillus sediminis TaxID=2809051 RepID=UPI001D0C3ED3|nr:hypothetical protein [Roseitranquillus sediminis]MBM9595768.1 hypothetical protein [Roseitranquillus sediminis]